MSLRNRIAAVAGVAVAVTVLIAALVVYFAVRSSLRGEVEQSLVERAERFEQRPPPRFQGGPPPEGFRPGGPPPRDEELGGAAGYVQRITPDGQPDRPPTATADLPVENWAADIAESGSGEDFHDMDVDGTHLLVYTRGIGERGAVQVARPLTEVDSVLDDVLTALIVIGLAGIGLAALLGSLVARTALQPITAFTRRTEEIAADPDISERIDVMSKDELGRLAESFNTTLDELERAVESQRQLVADASHELRTPIASLRANIQTLEHADELPSEELAALREDVIAELDELTALVADVVELARGARTDDQLDDIRLDELVKTLVERARRRGGNYTTKLDETLIRGERDRISRAVSNLLDNARKWSPPDGAIQVELKGGTLSVRDHGPGFADEDLPHVFERFYRAKESRGMPGSGLGLAIVKQAAEAHGGSVEARNAPDGGALMRVRFSS
jgi:two-component system sensor histidine kinase MprB